MSRSTNAAGRQIIKDEEALCLNAYLCDAGVPTIGYGHTRGVHLGMRLNNEQEADELLAQDLRQAEEAVDHLVTYEMSDNEFSALVSFVFNVGAGNFAQSTLLARLNEGDFDCASDEMARWNKLRDRRTGQLVVAGGLVRRRKKEGDLFNTEDGS